MRPNHANKLVRFDWAIKYLLRNKTNFDVLEGFLSELLKSDIKIEALLESESNQQSQEEKYNRVDLLVRNEKQEHIIIEVQANSEWDYLSRILYGTSKAIIEYLSKGSPYKDVRKVISVTIAFFNLGDGKDYLYKGMTQFVGLHYHDILRLGEKEQSIYGKNKLPSEVFPEYYIIKVNQFDQKIKDKFDEWMYFLNNEDVEPEFNAKGIQVAAEKLSILKLSKERRYAYERYQENLHYEASMALSTYGVGKIEGREEGHKEGHAEGLKQAQEIALAKIKQIALSLKQSGLSPETVAQHTGFSIEEIEEI